MVIVAFLNFDRKEEQKHYYSTFSMVVPYIAFSFGNGRGQERIKSVGYPVPQFLALTIFIY